MTALWWDYKQSKVRACSKTELRARPDGIHWNDPMADNLPAVLVDAYPYRRKSGKNHLEESIKYRIMTIIKSRLEICL